jgi:hypothetical protein
MRRRRRFARWYGLLFVLAATSCRAKEAPVPYHLAIKVTGDPGKAISDAVVSRDRVEVCRTGRDGVARFDLEGADGDTIGMEVACPPGYKSPPGAVPVRLRRLSDPKQSTEYDVSCPPSIRKVVVAVRATNGKDLPVIYLGQEVARTDASGAAHVELDAAPDDTVELTLSTSEKGNERLKPQNPSAKFIVKNQDEVFVFSTDFVLDSDKRPAGAPRPKTQVGPTRLPSLSKLR